MPANYPRHRDFMRLLKKTWDNFQQVRIGRWTGNGREVTRWCEENLNGKFYFSPNYEVFYFDNHEAALHFKLKWITELQARLVS